MFTDQLRRAIEAARRSELPTLAGALWKGHAAGAIPDDEAQALAELIEARKVVRPVPAAPRRTGSRPRTSASAERRRRWAASGWMPPVLAARFTLAEVAVLAVVAAETVKGRPCRLTLGHIAALAGCCRTTVRNAIRTAQGLGLLVSEEWRLTAWRSAPNAVRIISPEWQAWLRLAAKRGGGVKSVNPTNTQVYSKGQRGSESRSSGCLVASAVRRREHPNLSTGSRR